MTRAPMEEEEEPLGVDGVRAAEQSCRRRAAQKEEPATEGGGGPTDTGDRERCGAGSGGASGDGDGQVVDEHKKAEKSYDEGKEVQRLSPDFPEVLYELLCTLQEGRRLNDQRCSFRLEDGVPRRRCHSEPNTNKPASRVQFSSMTSLQKEEFFQLVATTQGRRLNDQRAELGRKPPPKAKSRSFRGSIKQLSFIRKPVPEPGPNEDLYTMILTTQAQGRLEEQRSRAPGPMDDEDFFSLLLRVQGGRMEEQRTEPPLVLLHATDLSG